MHNQVRSGDQSTASAAAISSLAVDSLKVKSAANGSLADENDAYDDERENEFGGQIESGFEFPELLIEGEEEE